MSPKQHVTLRDIAKAAGVTAATVSMALRNHPNISAKRRQEIIALAHKLGYRRDPMIARLMTSMRQGRTKSERLPLAWINCSRDPDFWTYDYSRPTWEGARDRAKALGYQLKSFHWFDTMVMPRRLSEILYHRGFQGIVMAGTEPVFDEEFDWSAFSLVQMLPRKDNRLRVPEIVPDHRGNYEIVLRQLQEKGYERIGLVVVNRQDTFGLQGFTAAHLRFNFDLPAKRRIPPFIIPDRGPDSLHKSPTQPKLLAWMKKHQVQALIHKDRRLVYTLEQAKLRVPEDIAVVHLSLAADVEGWAGIDPNLRAQGEAAINALTMQVERNEQGFSSVEQTLLIKGTWHDGFTAPPKKA